MSVNTDLNLGKLDLSELEGKSHEQIVDILADELKGLSESEREEYVEGLSGLLEEIEESLYLEMDELEEEIKGEDVDFLKEKSERKLEDLEELLECLEDYDDCVGDATTRLDFYNQEHTANTTIDWNTNSDNQVEDGDVITVEVPNGAGITGLTSEDDEVTALPEFSVDLTINMGNDKVTSVEYDSSTQTTTYHILTKDGVNFDLVIDGAAKQTIMGNAWINPSLLNSLSDDYLKMAYDNNKSLFHYVNGFDSESVVSTTEAGIEVLENFETDLAELYTMREIADGSIDATTLKSILLTIYGSDLFIPESEISLTEAMEDIKELLADFDEEDRLALVGALSYTIAQNDSENYALIFNESVTEYFREVFSFRKYAGETEQLDHNYSDFEKAMWLVFEEMATGGTGMETLLAEWNTTTATFSTLSFIKENMTVISVDEAYADQIEESESNPIIEFNNTLGDDLKSRTLDLFYQSVSKSDRDRLEEYGYSKREIVDSYFSDTKFDTLFSHIEKLFQNLEDKGRMTVKDMQDAIRTYMSGLPNGYYWDDFASVALCLIKESDPTCFSALAKPQDPDAKISAEGEYKYEYAEGWIEHFYHEIITNGGKKAAAVYVLKDYLIDEGHIL